MLLQVALLAIAAALPGLPQADRRITLVGDHFRLTCHFDNRAVAQSALDIVEATWKPAAALYGVVDSDTGALLEVHLYRNAADYTAAEAQLTGGKFRRNLAFAHWDTVTAHVAVQPDLSDEVLEHIGLSTQTLRLLVHEAAHLVRFRAMPNYRAHPGWFADGNASWIEVEVLRDRGLLESPVLDPGFSTNVIRVQSLIERDRLPSVADVLLDRTDKLQFYERYACRWLLFDFTMRTRASAMKRAIADMRRFDDGADFTSRAAAAVRKRIGRAGWRKIDDEFRDFVRALQPQWEQVYRSLETDGDQWVQTAFRSTNAIAWRAQPIKPSSYDVAGTLTLLPGRATQLNLLLGRSRSGFVSVAFTAGYGVTVFEYHSRGDRFERLARQSVGLAPDKPIRFRASYLASGELSVDVDGKQVLEVDLDRDMRGPWGLGAQAGSAGVWQDVELAPRR